MDDPARRVLLDIAAQQPRDTSGAVDTMAPRCSPQALPGSIQIAKVWIQTPGPELSRRFDIVQRRSAPRVPYDYRLFYLLTSWHSSMRLNYFVKTGECNYSSKLHKFQLRRKLIFVVLGTWSYSGAGRWCYY